MQITSLNQAIVKWTADLIFTTRRKKRHHGGDSQDTRQLFLFNALRHPAGLIMISAKRVLVALVVSVVVLTTGGRTTFSSQLTQDTPRNPQAPQAPQAPQVPQPAQAQQGPQSVPLTPEDLQQLVAPIALYPDALVAQILAASTYPTQIVEADRWVQEHSNLKEDKLAKEVDKEPWDPSVKALTPFASVLSNLDTNLSWTSALGDAYYNQQQDVLDAIQVLRTRAKAAGNLESNTQETVTNQGPTIIIEPTDPDVCYLPSYDPWLVYGAPIGIYPGYLYNSFYGGPFISFGLGIRIGSNSRTFFHRFPGAVGGNFRNGPGSPEFHNNHGPGDIGRNRDGGSPDRNFDQNRGQGAPDSNFGHDRGGISNGAQDSHDLRGFGQQGPNTGTRSGAFSGFGQGGPERGSASRGRNSFGGGGGFGGGRGFGGGHGFGGGRGFGGGGGFRGGGGMHGGGGRH